VPPVAKVASRAKDLPVKIILADDHDLFRESVAAMMEAEGDLEVVALPDLAGVLTQLGLAPADLVLLDYQMPGMNGLEGLEAVIGLSEGRPVALITGATRRDLAEQAMAAGAAGFVPKTIGVKAMISAVRLMAQGGRFAPMALLDETPARVALFGELTRREIDVLRGICEGKSNKEIARDLDVQEVTIKLHVKTLSRKLGARNRTHAAMIARDHGLSPG
jgi:DNA-binding NarL/FixJ family response regulator